MQHHHDWIINIPLSILFVTMPWWIATVEGYGWITTHFLIPTFSLIAIILQIAILWQKFRR